MNKFINEQINIFKKKYNINNLIIKKKLKKKINKNNN